MIKRFIAIAAVLLAGVLGALVVPADSPVAPPPAAAVTSCGGQIGQPQWVNVGDFRNTLGVSFTNYIYVYPGSYKYYCPNYIYVHSGKDIYVVCYVGSSWAGSRTFTAYGWNSTPSWMDSMTKCNMVEYNQ